MTLFAQAAAALPLLIRLFWVLATFAATIALIPPPFATSFRNAVLLSACRGKLMEFKPSAALGPLSDWTVPQSWFSHFYAVGAAWNVVVTVAFLASTYAKSLDPMPRAAYAAALALVEVHLVRRLLETVGLMRYPAGARMHGVAYIFGMIYYLVVPLTVVPGPAFSCMLGSFSLQEHFKGAAAVFSTLYEVVENWSWGLVLGGAIFLAGNALQLHSHALLARLGGAASSTSKSPRYRIPRGGGFEVVSCPHYLAEIIIYLGLAVMLSGVNNQAWLMLAWVVANLVLAARLTHSWYLHHFKTYPRRRKALIPFIY